MILYSSTVAGTKTGDATWVRLTWSDSQLFSLVGDWVWGKLSIGRKPVVLGRNMIDEIKALR